MLCGFLTGAAGFSPTKSSLSGPGIDWRDPAALSAITGETDVSIAVTPNGLADALHEDANGTTYFVQPYSEKMPLAQFFNRLGTFLCLSGPVLLTDSISVDNSSNEVHYLQSQNGNIYRHAYEQEAENETAPELAAFQEYIEPEVGFLSEALGK